MGRRGGGVTALLDLTTKLPWQISLALAPISFLVLKMVELVSARSVQVARPGQLGAVVLYGYAHTFAILGELVLPFVFLIGAAVAYVKRSRSGRTFDSVQEAPRTRIASLSWQQFEELIGEGFRRQGFSVTNRARGGADGGIDLTLAKDHERFVVQCKHWRAQQVGVTVVRELYGVMAAEGVAGGYVVTSGSFTREAKAFAQGRNIVLLDGRGVEELVRQAENSTPRPVDATEEIRSVGPKPPDCPACKTPMVLRTAKQGSHKGSSFWGCARFPICREIISRS